eukprot:Em0020g492a
MQMRIRVWSRDCYSGDVIRSGAETALGRQRLHYQFSLIKSEYFQSLVCTEVCRSPVTCKSGHLFCHGCLSESFRRNSSCPACWERLTAPVPSAIAAAQVSALDVMCVHNKCKLVDRNLWSVGRSPRPHEPIKCSGEGGCGELVPRGEMATHQQFVCLQSCPNSKAKAKRPYGTRNEQDSCDVRLSRHDIVDHLKDYCELRIIHCPHASCEVTTRYNQMAAHLEVCPYAPVPCPRQCAAADLIRPSLEKHKNECPNEPVPCVHAPLGCSHVAPRSEIIGHEQDIAIHFSSLRSKVFAEQQEAYQQKMDEMKQVFQQKLQTLEEKITKQQIFEEKLKEQNTLLRKLEEQNALLTRKVEEQSATFNWKLQDQTAVFNTKLQEQTVLLTERTVALVTRLLLILLTIWIMFWLYVYGVLHHLGAGDKTAPILYVPATIIGNTQLGHYDITLQELYLCLVECTQHSTATIT